MKQKLINLVMKFIINRYFKTRSFVDLPDENVWAVYMKMNSQEIKDVLKHRFTNIFADHYSKGGDALIMAKGRLFELSELMDDIESAESKLLHIAEIKRRQEYFEGTMKKFGQATTSKIKNKLKGFAKKLKSSEPE